jgi:medium-chain acyl-[acyl-carrier-protein] hydrolase
MSLRLLRVVPPSHLGSVRLFCIPFAGGSASFYDGWLASAPRWLQVCPIELPGRGWLSSEPLPTSLSKLAREISSALYPYTDVPYAIFGHSMGALLAYEVASHLESSGRLQLRRLFVSGSRAPFVPHKEPPVSDLPDAEFWRHIRDMQGTPEEILAQPELTELLLPLLRSDFAICEQYRLQHAYFLQAPVTALSGEQDERAPISDMQMWGRLTSSGFRSLEFSGGHFFLKENESAVINAVCSELAAPFICADPCTEEAALY